jgi:hypothetical protein
MRRAAILQLFRRILKPSAKPESLGWSRWLGRLGRLDRRRVFRLGQEFIHALLEVTLVIVLPAAIV